MSFIKPSYRRVHQEAVAHYRGTFEVVRRERRAGSRHNVLIRPPLRPPPTALLLRRAVFGPPVLLLLRLRLVRHVPPVARRNVAPHLLLPACAVTSAHWCLLLTVSHQSPVRFLPAAQAGAARRHEPLPVLRGLPPVRAAQLPQRAGARGRRPPLCAPSLTPPRASPARSCAWAWRCSAASPLQ